MAELRAPIECGVPDPMPLMHPVMAKNYGKWVFHDHPKAGVLRHRAASGDELWTVKAGTQRQMDLYTIRKLCDIADQYADGHVRFTARSNPYVRTDGWDEEVEKFVERKRSAG